MARTTKATATAAPTKQAATPATPESEVAALTVPTLAELAEEKHVDRFGKQAENDVINPIVLATLVGCRPQMVYNYIRKGKIAGAKDNNTQKLVIPLQAAQAWADSYLRGKAQKLVDIKAELAVDGVVVEAEA